MLRRSGMYLPEWVMGAQNRATHSCSTALAAQATGADACAAPEHTFVQLQAAVAAAVGQALPL